MKKPSDDWDELRDQILGFGAGSSHKSYYPALRKRIAELQRIELDLRESRERLQMVLKSADLGMWDWNIPTGHVLYDRRWMEIIGRKPGELPPNVDVWLDLLHPEDKAAALAIVDANLAGRTEDFTQEFRLQHKDGHWVWILAKGRVIERDETGAPLRACGTHLDITRQKQEEDERRRLEIQVQHAQKLESLGVLAGGIAHDFNNLLVSILGNADLALSDITPASPLWPNLDEIRTAAKRASELTNQMLAYSGRGRFVVEAVSLNDVVDEMGRLLEVSIPKKVVLRYDLVDGLPSVEADTTQIRQVVMNLVTNAADAMENRSGVITIATGLIEADQRYLDETYAHEDLSEGYYVSLEVSDTGCGMDKGVQERMFDPFFTTKSTGRGLGMAAVMGIVRGHRGAIRVYSEPERGTTFKILLPACDAVPARDQRPVSEATDETTGLDVLVVDDEESVRVLAKRMLERLGYVVRLASDGSEAVTIYENQGDAIDLVLLDMTMPKMDGQETYRALRALDPEVRVVLSSGYNEQDATDRFAGRALAGFIQKPYTLDTLASVMREAVR
jgi:PAS domain S-box-containing protein